MLPAWVYCSDDCHRLENNRKVMEKKVINSKKLAIKKDSIV